MTDPSDVYLVSSFAPFRVLCAFARNPTRNLFSRKDAKESQRRRGKTG